MSLAWSNYSFDEEIDKKALSEIIWSSSEELEELQNAFWVLKDFGISFDGLLSQIKNSCGKEDFKEQLKSAVSFVSSTLFSNLDDVYSDLDIWDNEQIKEVDITSFTNIDSPDELRDKIRNIREKFLKIKSKVWELQASVLKDYKSEIKELLQRKSIDKKKELEVLKFMKNSWFDLFPKKLTNRIIHEVKSSMLIIPWLPLSGKNIDLKNGNFWESSVFINKEVWINIESKRNLVKFMNKMISWNINEPLAVDELVNGFSVVDPIFLKNKFIESNIFNGLGWQYITIIENLKKI